MTNRVLLGKNGTDYGLWVSKSGDNVLSPTQELLFDSEESGYWNSVISGTTSTTVSYTRGSQNPNNTLYYYSTTSATTGTWLNYGATFSYIPMIFYASVTTSSGTNTYSQYGPIYLADFSSGKSGSIYDYVRPYLFQGQTSRCRQYIPPHTIMNSDVGSSYNVTLNIIYNVIVMEP